MDFLTSCTNRLCYYLSENLEYARYVNKCVTDFAMDLVAYYDDLMFKIKYNNITDKNEIMKRVCNNDEARFSGFVFFPIDINKDKIDNKYPFFIRKSKTNELKVACRFILKFLIMIILLTKMENQYREIVKECTCRAKWMKIK